ncbi:hypothetical protein DBR24_06180 [Pseudomonas sp. HMWF006]|nr:hypothetical protein DBR24_06180 [Pseudomonas sp. HMWF006]PTT73979.1 hypothetical protein DBR26_01630 [Pseudomonas sp. HMWF007]PTT83709.1 hypothetical protein DBR29_24985 [Pseudomonas sp. HMWF005]
MPVTLFVLHTPVGASLLAKASIQSISTETDTPLSRASSLPQLDQRRAAMASTDSRISAGPL